MLSITNSTSFREEPNVAAAVPVQAVLKHNISGLPQRVSLSSGFLWLTLPAAQI